MSGIEKAAPLDSAQEGDEAPVVSVRSLSVRLGGRAVLRDVDLEMKRGELWGLVGTNGAGKTTLIRALVGVLTPQAGEVLVGGGRRRARDGLVGYLPQQTPLDPELPLRARDLVALGLDGYRLGVPLPSARRRARAEEMLEAVDAMALADQRIGELSGGEQKRVLIAHALARRPRLLVLDEPFASLDIGSEQEVVGLLARISHEQELAVLVSTHDMNSLLPVMDKVAYLAQGRLASGTPAEVVNTESLSRLYGRHVDVVHVHDRVLVVAGRDSAGYRHTGQEPVVEVV